MKHVTMFLDTNSLLHYPPLRDIDWRKVCGATAVQLVLCMEVIHELDDKKSDPRLSSRANRVIGEVGTIRSSGGSVRDGVTLEVFNEELRASDFAPGLSPDSADDRIVHLAKRYIQKSGNPDVAIYSEDLGMALRCEAHGVRCLEPDKSVRLENPQTEQDRKYKAAITELNQLKSLVPELAVWAVSTNCQAGDERKPLEVCISRAAELDDVEQAVQQERNNLRMQRTDATNMPAGPIRDVVASMSSTELVPASEHKRYEREVAAYLVRYREWLEAMKRSKANPELIFRFRLVVDNIGKCPAEDVEAELRFPPRLTFVACKRECAGTMPTAPQKPEPPDKPRSIMETARSEFARLRLPDLTGLPQFEMPDFVSRGDPSFSLDGNLEVGFGVRLHMPKLVQHRREEFGDFYSRFRSWDAASSFEVQLFITAANIPTRIERTVPIIVRVTE